MSGSTRVSRYQKGKTKKVKTNLDLLEQEIGWAQDIKIRDETKTLPCWDRDVGLISWHGTFKYWDRINMRHLQVACDRDVEMHVVITTVVSKLT